MLAQMEGRPWAEFGRNGKPITPSQLARQLHRFDVKPGKLRIADQTPNGYYRKDFDKAFARYLPHSKWNTGTTLENIDDSRVLEAEHEEDVFHPENAVFTNKDGLCSSVPVANPHPIEQDKLLI